MIKGFRKRLSRNTKTILIVLGAVLVAFSLITTNQMASSLRDK